MPSTTTSRQSQAKEQKPENDDSKIPGFEPPESLEELEELIDRAKLRNKTLHVLPKKYFQSGSRVTDRQHVMFMPVCPPARAPDHFEEYKDRYGLDKVWAQAEHIVGKPTEFQRYPCILENKVLIKSLKEGDDLWPGVFKAVRELHEQVVAVKTRAERKLAQSGSHQGTLNPAATEAKQESIASSKGERIKAAFKRKLSTADSARTNSQHPPDAEDEASVNAALIVVLQALTSLVQGADFEWVFNRVEFKSSFEANEYTAHVDGALRHCETHDLRAIVEAKKNDSQKRWEVYTEARNPGDGRMAVGG